MATVFERLERVLRLESEQGYQNKAVVGGIRQFAAFWVGQAQEQAVDEADTFFVEQIGDILTDYNRLPGVEARARVVDDLLQKLAVRQQQVQPITERRSVPSRRAENKPVRSSSRKSAESPPPPPPPQPEPERPPAAPAAEAAPPQPEIDPDAFDQSVTTVRGVGPKVAALLAKLGATTVGELLALYPRRYDDYSVMKPINRLEIGEVVTVIGSVWETRARRTRTNQVIVQSVISDGTGKIQATWFNQQWLADKLRAGMQVVLSGKVEQYLGRPVLNNPEWEPLSEDLLKTGRIVPVYPLTKGLSSTRMRAIMKATVDTWSNRLPEPVPTAILQRRSLMGLPQAVQQVHFADSQTTLQQAQQRLIFDELFLLQLGMLSQRREWQTHPAVPLKAAEGALDAFLAQFPFEPTGAQQRSTEEIIAEMSRDVPMNRLLQGDVGAGKTLVAAAAMVAAVSAGAQAALMAPTEILAEQHFKGLDAILTPLGHRVRLLTGSTPAAEKQQIYDALADGSADIVIGTHALIQPTVSFKQLGLAVIDEQHRFGVDQRGLLRDKGPDDASPHLLVMSATPIPRTLALSLYGDLDLSILDEMPPGRQEIKTRWLPENQRERAYRFIRRQIESGRQAFIIYPLVEASESVEAKAAVDDHAYLQTDIFPNLKLGLVHGRMKSAEKEAVMRQFHAGDLDILVATTVIEVGIDVPNASVILIDGANRFGLAQLHQLRGRVGRGVHQSYCILISDSTTADAIERLTALEETNDGFQLAEKDLEIRGPGEFFGRKQSGIPELRLASLFDTTMLDIARAEAETIFETDPLLNQPEHQLLQARVAAFWQDAGDVS